MLQAMMSTAQAMMSTAQAARAAGLSAERVRQRLRSGALPSVRTPLGYLIDPADIERLATQRRAGR